MTGRRTQTNVKLQQGQRRRASERPIDRERAGGGGGGVETSKKGRKEEASLTFSGGSSSAEAVLSLDTPHKQNVCHFSLVPMEKTNLA